MNNEQGIMNFEVFMHSRIESRILYRGSEWHGEF